jgi:acetyl esterase/lipase
MQQAIGRTPPSAESRLCPRTAAEWKTLNAQRVRAILQQLDELRERLRVSVATRVFAGVHCHLISPHGVPARNCERLLISLRGGGYVFKSGAAGTLEAMYLAGLTGHEVIAVDYRIPPDHPFPAAIEDAMAVWSEVVKLARPANIAIFGTSAGGGLALAMAQRARREGLPRPAAVIACTPWSDLSKTGDSYFANADVDNSLVAYEGLLETAARLYANGIDLKDPRLSPVYGDFTDFPPAFLATGTRDLFLSNTVRVHRKLRQAGVQAQLHVYEGQSHGQLFLSPDAPETLELFAEIADFLDAHLGR